MRSNAPGAASQRGRDKGQRSKVASGDSFFFSAEFLAFAAVIEDRGARLVRTELRRLKVKCTGFPLGRNG